MNGLPPDRYYDEPYGRGSHVVLLCLPDDLYDRAIRPFERIAARVQRVSFWVVTVTTAQQAEAVQALRYPQYRFIHNGSEQHVHTGVLDDEQLFEALDHLEC